MRARRRYDDLFDRFAEAASELASHATFFIACVLLVVLWAPSYFVLGNLNTWQLVINTATTIVTFLLVALLQNSQRRNETAMNKKLDALADGLADLMDHVGGNDLEPDIEALRETVGIESPVTSEQARDTGRGPSEASAGMRRPHRA